MRKWPLRRKSRFVLEYHTSKSVVTVQRAFRAKYAKVFVPPLPRDLADLKARIIATVKNFDALMLTRVRQELECRIDVCAVSPVVHTPNTSSCKKKKKFSCGCEQFHYAFLGINVCNHGERYETPCIW